MRRAIGTAAILTLGLAPGTAGASSATMQDGHLVYLADAGEANAVTIEHTGDRLLTVTDTGAVIRASDGCVPKGPHVAECGHSEVPEFGDLHWHSVNLDDGDDSLRVLGHSEIDYLLRGGSGDDTIMGGDARDHIAGEDGADRLEGGGGDDSFVGGAGPDLTRGGPGVDTTNYADRTGGVRVVIGDGPGDGEPGEDDDVQTEQVEGGAGDDELIGNDVGNLLRGGPGADVLTGRGGDDQLVGNDHGFVDGQPRSEQAGDAMRCGSGLDAAETGGPDVAADDCEHLAHDSPMRMSVGALERPDMRRIRASVRRTDLRIASVAEAFVAVPCGPVQPDGRRCWRRIGRSREPRTIPAGEERAVDVLLSRTGRAWLRRHPRRRMRLTVRGRDPRYPDAHVELRLPVRVPRP